MIGFVLTLYLPAWWRTECIKAREELEIQVRGHDNSSGKNLCLLWMGNVSEDPEKWRNRKSIFEQSWDIGG